MPRISFVGTTAKLWRRFLHPKSILIREYPPREKSQKPWVIQTCLHHPLSILRAKCSLRCLLPKWSRCPGYSNHTREHHQEADHGAFHRWLVFIVSAALSQPKSWHAQSSICKTPCQTSKSLAGRDRIHPLHHLVDLSWSLTRSSWRASSQIYALRFASSVGYKYRRRRVFGGQLRPEEVDERCGHWDENVLGRTCRLDEALVGVDLVGWENMRWWSILNHCLVGQLVRYCEIWLNLGSGRIFHSQVRRGCREQVFSLALRQRSF